MTPTRRRLFRLGGGFAAALAIRRPAFGGSDGAVEIAMAGRGDGSAVWFDPVGIRIRPGQRVRWVNRDAGNSHTATAYHPSNFGRPRRVPAGAEGWDSDYLLPQEEFELMLTVPGVYDYYCVPHEHAGMVGRIVVGAPGPKDAADRRDAGAGLPEAALRAFPSVAEIMAKGTVRRAYGHGEGG